MVCGVEEQTSYLRGAQHYAVVALHEKPKNLTVILRTFCPIAYNSRIKDIIFIYLATAVRGDFFAPAAGFKRFLCPYRRSQRCENIPRRGRNPGAVARFHRRGVYAVESA